MGKYINLVENILKEEQLNENFFKDFKQKVKDFFYADPDDKRKALTAIGLDKKHKAIIAKTKKGFSNWFDGKPEDFAKDLVKNLNDGEIDYIVDNILSPAEKRKFYDILPTIKMKHQANLGVK